MSHIELLPCHGDRLQNKLVNTTENTSVEETKFSRINCDLTMSRTSQNLSNVELKDRSQILRRVNTCLTNLQRKQEYIKRTKMVCIMRNLILGVLPLVAYDEATSAVLVLMRKNKNQMRYLRRATGLLTVV